MHTSPSHRGSFGYAEEMAVHDEILALARSRPAAALKRIGAILNLGDVAGIDRIRILQAGGIAARLTGDLAVSNRFLRDAIALSEQHGDETGFVQANITRAGNSLLAGNPNDAVKRLESLGQPEDPELAARLGLQLGTVYARSSRFDQAVIHFSAALQAAHEANDQRLIAVVTKNRGMLRIFSGDYKAARSDLEFARKGFDELGIDIEVAYCDHNLGQVADYTGDLARALPLFRAAEARIAKLASSEWEVQASHCDALLHAGLGEEAAQLAETISKRMDQADHNLDRGEALLAWAKAELLRGDYAASRDVAIETVMVFERQQRADWKAHAALVGTLARAHLGEPIDIAALELIGKDIDAQHMPLAWLETELAAADACVTSRPQEAVNRLRNVQTSIDRAPVDLRLAATALVAEARLQLGNRRGSDAAARKAFRLLFDYQRLLASGDLQVAVRRHARRAGTVGLASAVESGRPRRVFDWLERDKWALLQSADAVTDPDPGLRTALARYRAIDAALRRGGGSDPALKRLHRDTETWIRDLNRAIPVTSTESTTPVTASAVADASGTTTIVALGVHETRLLAVKIRKGRATAHLLGSSDDAERLSRLARSSLGRVARHIPTAGATDDLGHLSAQIIDPLGVIDNQVVILPTPGLFGAPWRALPGLTGSRVSVSPSATMWLRRPKSIADSGPPLLVSGPDLDHGQTEVEHISAALTGSDVLTGAEATVDATLEAANNATLVHIAAHGTNRMDNPLFSSLRLADGPMNVHELGQLANPPTTVVLSACHVGLPAEAPGHELLGLVGGLLRIGTRTIVASTIALPDDTSTAGFMTAFHRSFADGESASAALIEAESTLPSPEAQLVYRGAINVYGGD